MMLYLCIVCLFAKYFPFMFFKIKTHMHATHYMFSKLKQSPKFVWLWMFSKLPLIDRYCIDKVSSQPRLDPPNP